MEEQLTRLEDLLLRRAYNVYTGTHSFTRGFVVDAVVAVELI